MSLFDNTTMCRTYSQKIVAWLCCIVPFCSLHGNTTHACENFFHLIMTTYTITMCCHNLINKKVPGKEATIWLQHGCSYSNSLTVSELPPQLIFATFSLHTE